MSNEQIDRKMIVNDDGWIMNFNKKGIDKNTLKTEMIDRYSGSPVDTISWCVGDHEVYDYETQIGEIFGADQEVTNAEKMFHVTTIDSTSVKSCATLQKEPSVLAIRISKKKCLRDVGK